MANVRGHVEATGEFIELTDDEMLHGIIKIIPTLISNWMSCNFSENSDFVENPNGGVPSLKVHPDQLMDLVGASMMSAPDLFEAILRGKIKAAEAAAKAVTS